MAVTYEPIASTTLGIDAATISLTSIPSTYTDLLVVLVAFQSIGGDQSIAIRINSDTGANYSDTNLAGTGSVAASNSRSSVTNMYVGEMSGTTAGYPSMIRLHLQSYANTNVNKTVLRESAAPASNVGRGVGLWRSTAAVDSILFRIYNGGAGNFKAGATLSLYGIGIKAA